MRVGLFIPCYIDQFYPRVGLATVRVLEKLGVEVAFPLDQTCCGQPMANTGCVDAARPLAEHFLRLFGEFEYVVGPTGSCVSMVRHHYDELLHGQPGFEELKGKTYELCEFIVDVLKVNAWEGRFPHVVGIHQSCHGLRELHLGKPSELVGDGYNKVRELIASLDGVRVAELQRPDECCGFGGTFAVNEEAVSCMMGQDRIHDHQQAGTEVLTASDMSCLMHLSGLIQRQRIGMRVMHVAEILEAAQSPDPLAAAAR